MTTKKKVTPKKKAVAKKKITYHTKGGNRGGLIKQIIDLHVSGLSNAEIEKKGYNKYTIVKQVGKYKAKTKKVAKPIPVKKKKIAPKKKKKA